MKWFSNLKIQWKIFLITGILTLGIAAYGWMVNQKLNEVKVNGPRYHHIVLGKDLVADILPPPKHIIEIKLVVHQMMLATDPGL